MLQIINYNSAFNNLEPRQQKLYGIIKKAHSKQKRKGFNKDYFGHVKHVAFASKDNLYGFEIGLCHDVIEDKEFTGYTLVVLKQKLIFCDYLPTEINTILRGVKALINIYTHEAFPKLNKNDRSILEAHSLASEAARHIAYKVEDCLHNCSEWEQLKDLKYAMKYVKWKLIFVNQVLVNLEDGIIEDYFMTNKNIDFSEFVKEAKLILTVYKFKIKERLQ